MTKSPPKIILYIEDSAVNIYLVQAIFNARTDVQLRTATSGAAGLVEARQNRPALILLDMHLPDMEGDAFVRALRADPSLSAIPVIIVSGDSLTEAAAQLHGLAVADYVSKPFDIDQFEQVVNRHLKP